MIPLTNIRHDRPTLPGHVRPRTLGELSTRLGLSRASLGRLAWPFPRPRRLSTSEWDELTRCRHWIATNILTDGYLRSRSRRRPLPPLRWPAPLVRRVFSRMGLSSQVCDYLVLLCTDLTPGGRRLTRDRLLTAALWETARLQHPRRPVTLPIQALLRGWGRTLQQGITRRLPAGVALWR